MPGFGRRDLLVEVQRDEFEDLLDFGVKRMQHGTGRRRFDHRQFRLSCTGDQRRHHAPDYSEFIESQLDLLGEIRGHGLVLHYHEGTAPARNRRPNPRGPRVVR